MDISVSAQTVTLKGNIKTVSNYQAIKNVLDEVVENHSNITLLIKDSISITSSVIGYLNKLILNDKIKINMIVGNEELMELLEELNLASLFQARKG